MGSSEPAVDVAFALRGCSLARDHAQALADALSARLPWLGGVPGAGVHAIRLAPGIEPCAWLPARARLLLRVPQSRAAELGALVGSELTVGETVLRLGSLKVHPLRAHGTLYAPFVAAARDDEIAFTAEVQAELAALGIACRTVCGLRRQRAARRGTLIGYSLLLHELDAASSLAVLRNGIGPQRLLGCGLFVPHRSAAAVSG